MKQQHAGSARPCRGHPGGEQGDRVQGYRPHGSTRPDDFDLVRITDDGKIDAWTLRRHLLVNIFVLVIENEAVPFDRRMWNIARALPEAGAAVSVICPMFGKDRSVFTVLDGIQIHRYTNTFADGFRPGVLPRIRRRVCEDTLPAAHV